MSHQLEQDDAARRRGARLRAMRNREEIPFPETSVQDARPGNVGDADIVAMLAGAAKRAAFFPASALVNESGWIFANENGVQTALAVGPFVPL